jgi:deoxyribose-phosphate aldolase
MTTITPLLSGSGELDASLRDWRGIAARLDHTFPVHSATREQIVSACELARDFGVRSIMPPPCWVPLAVAHLHGTPVKVVGSVGHPLGASLASVKRYEADELLRLGAQELEVVANVGELKSDGRVLVGAELCSIGKLVHDAGCKFSVRLELPLLGIDLKILACELAAQSGADCVVASIGGYDDSVANDIALLRGVLGARAQISVAGDIRQIREVSSLIAAGADRVAVPDPALVLVELGAPAISH